MPIHNTWCACFPASPDQTNGSSVFPGQNEPASFNLDTYLQKYPPYTLPQPGSPTNLGPRAEGLVRRDGDSLREGRGAARVLGPQGDADTNHDFSSVQCGVLGNVHRQAKFGQNRPLRPSTGCAPHDSRPRACMHALLTPTVPRWPRGDLIRRTLAPGTAER